MTTDTSERGIERLICTALPARPAIPAPGRPAKCASDRPSTAWAGSAAGPRTAQRRSSGSAAVGLSRGAAKKVKHQVKAAGEQVLQVVEKKPVAFTGSPSKRVRSSKGASKGLMGLAKTPQVG